MGVNEGNILLIVIVMGVEWYILKVEVMVLLFKEKTDRALTF